MKKSEKEMEIQAWHLLLEDDAYRLDWPDDFYRTLINRADELVLREVISLEEWQRLKDAADRVHAQTLHHLAAQQRDRVDTVSIDLCIDTAESTQR
ncbi:hypothetical protein [Pseudomonas orientalis]|uniref:Uncharacterized protein n=1 Tax=Pseudomonas orientalis TaxID=76758 RepID=A0A0R2ZM65_9PSED|nr:hypothetical protein [Pseudomonas orientalis]AZE88762.1 hypothetical protein C4J97_2061 [Pseudomonas orientalis]AZE94137.1 hypothetical protein C4J96_2019 [Pseudomonas orientalis]AZE99581.1 hypothetical protein C4J95_2119 [Pseudomonas orientalis]KRP62032.1 hypothetical protein TU82_22815 [Pseudomonas orientalis]SDT87494.1 hypothetical protein SAMN04490197_0234 [Pseudomonas orientalis]